MKLCLFCNSFKFFEGSRGYSEYTPGSEGYLGCGLNIWSVNVNYDKEEEYRNGLEMATKCGRFDPRPEYKEV